MPLLEAQAADVRAMPSKDSGSPTATGITVPRAFLEQARLAACHSAADRWALLYEILWRLVGEERHLLQLHGDPQVIRLNAYAKSVARDFHKMKAFVRFRGVEDPQSATNDGLRYVAWFEPTHHIVEHASPFFRRRFANMRWSILTPDRCAHYEGKGEVWFSQGVDRAAAPSSDALEEVWLMYYRSIFNPARLKVRAMLSEMPQKYWKNLPEAHLIPSLVSDANQRTAAMQAHRRTVDEPRCGPRPISPGEQLAQRLASVGHGTLEHLALEARGCRRCPLWEAATQTVWGEGPASARIMLVGEQPGDREDLTGRPFVGPAGQLLDRALAEAGLDRRSLYLTNTVKHFKFKSRGRRRIHEKPSDAEALACLPWLQSEIARVRPALLVCLGATAARALLGRAVKVNVERGRVMEGAQAHYAAPEAQAGSPASDVAGPALLVTFHPSYLLRLEQETAAADAYVKFVEDLRLAKAWSEGAQAGHAPSAFAEHRGVAVST
jgi:DNA polymerase